jgi:hypothetical protein
MLLLNVGGHTRVAHFPRASRTTILHYRVRTLLHLMVVVGRRLVRSSLEMIGVLLLLMMSSLSVLWNKVLLVSCLIIRLVVRLDRGWSWPKRELGINKYLLFKPGYSSLHHSAVVVTLVSTCWVILHLVMGVHLWAVKRFLICGVSMLRLRLLLSHHKVLNRTIWMSFHHVGILLVLSVRFTLSLRHAGTLRARSLFLRLLSVGSILWA